MNRRSPIGLDLGSSCIKAAQLDASGRVLAATHIRRPEPGTPIDASDFSRLLGVLYRMGFTGRRIAIGAPKSIVHRLTLELPPLHSGAPIDRIAESELARQRRLEPGSFEFHWYETPQPPRHAAGTRAIAVSCTHTDAGALLDLAEDAGLDPIGLHSPAAAAAYAITRNGTPAPTAVIDLGWSDTTFIATRDGTIRFVRGVGSSGLGALIGGERWLRDSIDRTVDARLHAEHDAGRTDDVLENFSKRYRAIVLDEIRSSLAYLEGCSGDESPGSIVLVGGGACLPGVRETIEAGTGLPTARPAGPAPNGYASAIALAAAPMREPRARATNTTGIREAAA